MCLHVITINERRGHKLKREEGEIYRRVSREERKWRNVVNYIIISKKTKPNPPKRINKSLLEIENEL